MNSATTLMTSHNDEGPVHVIALSGESGRYSSLTAPEVAWLEADLAAAAAARARSEIGWIVSHVHYPNVPTGCGARYSFPTGFHSRMPCNPLVPIPAALKLARV
jgi:hypothetical protein